MGKESKLSKTDIDAALVKDTHNDLLAMDERKGRNAKVEFLSTNNGADAVVLGDPLFGNVHVGNDLKSARERKNDFARKAHTVHHHAIYAIADPDAVLHGLNVDVARLVGNSLGEN